MPIVNSLVTRWLRDEVIDVAIAWIKLKRQEASVLQEQADLLNRWAGVQEIAAFLDPEGNTYSQRVEELKTGVQQSLAAGDFDRANGLVDGFNREASVLMIQDTSP